MEKHMVWKISTKSLKFIENLQFYEFFNGNSLKKITTNLSIFNFIFTFYWVQIKLNKRLKSNDLMINPSTDHSKLVNFYYIDENDQTFPKAISTTNRPKIKVNGVLVSSRLTLSNEILTLILGHD